MKKLIHETISLFHMLLVLICDSIVIYGCFRLGYRLWVESPYRMKMSIPPFDSMEALFNVLVIVSILIWGGTYRMQSSVSHVVRLKDIVKYLLIGFGATVLASFFTKYLLVGRLQAFLTFAIMIPAMVIERILVDRLWTHFVVKRFLLKRIVIYGAGDTGKRLAKSIDKYPKLGYRAIGFFDDHKKSRSIVMSNPIPVLGGKDKFIRFLKNRRKSIDEVHIAMPAASSTENKVIMNICQQYRVPCKFVPTLNDLMLHRVVQEQLDGIPLFSPGELNISLVNRTIKRLFDVLFSTIVLVVGLPIVGFVAVMIKRDSPGPILFRQKRVGFRGREFVMVKFRTMFVESPRYHSHPRKSSDPRITRVGRFLRKTSLDEFPQFWNVLKSDMSIVGPRPEMPFIVKTYTPYQRERLNAKPGITGLWQISGDRSLPIHENIDHDLYYIAHQSFLLDVVIIFQTIWFALIRGVGAK